MIGHTLLPFVEHRQLGTSLCLAISIAIGIAGMLDDSSNRIPLIGYRRMRLSGCLVVDSALFSAMARMPRAIGTDPKGVGEDPQPPQGARPGRIGSAAVRRVQAVSSAGEAALCPGGPFSSCALASAHSVPLSHSAVRYSGSGKECGNNA